MKCQNCAAEWPEGTQFCPACGMRIAGPAEHIAEDKPRKGLFARREKTENNTSAQSADAPQDENPAPVPEKPPEPEVAPEPAPQLQEQRGGWFGKKNVQAPAVAGDAFALPEELPAEQEIPAEKPKNPREPMGVFAYIGMLLLLCIPVVNIVLVIRWAFSRTVNINRRHFAVATLILWIAAIAVLVTLGILFPGIYAPVLELLGTLFLVG